MSLADGLIPFLLRLEIHQIHKIGHCHKLRLLLVHLLLPLVGSWPEDDGNPLLSQFLQAYYQLSHAKGEAGPKIEKDNQ